MDKFLEFRILVEKLITLEKKETHIYVLPHNDIFLLVGLFAKRPVLLGWLPRVRRLVAAKRISVRMSNNEKLELGLTTHSIEVGMSSSFMHSPREVLGET